MGWSSRLPLSPTWNWCTYPDAVAFVCCYCPLLTMLHFVHLLFVLVVIATAPSSRHNKLSNPNCNKLISDYHPVYIHPCPAEPTNGHRPFPAPQRSFRLWTNKATTTTAAETATRLLPACRTTLSIGHWLSTHR